MPALTSLVELPNPDVYLNHLPPADARDFETSRNVAIVVLGAMLWDILVYIPDDLWILSHNPFHFPIICFVSSRLFSAAFVLANVVQSTTVVDHADTFVRVTGLLLVVAVACSSFLFLRRVHAVYMENRAVRWCFSVLWAISAVAQLAVPLGVIPGFIPGTRYISAIDRPVVATGIVTGIVFDSSVFLAISYKIASTHSLTDARVTWRTLASGKALPRLSRAILQGGQQYYLITVGMLALSVIVLPLPSIGIQAKNVFVIPLSPLTASMACRVFRNLKLFDLRASGFTTR